MRPCTAIRAGAWCAAVSICFCLGRAPVTGQATNQAEENIPASRIQKITLTHANAVDLAIDLGGNAVRLPGRAGTVASASSMEYRGALAALLPQDVEALIGMEVDNTLLVKGRDEAIRDMRALVRILDQPYRQVDCRADATLVLTDRAGRKHRRQWSMEGRAIVGRPIHLRTAASGDGQASAPATVSNDVDITTWHAADGSVRVQADWYAELRWKPNGKAQAPIIRGAYRTDALVESGGEVLVSRARSSTPSGGSAELELRISPRIVESSVPPSSGTAPGR